MVELETPTLEEEIARKTTEAIDWSLRSYQRHYISAHAFETAINAIFMCVGGLVSEDLTRALSLNKSENDNKERHTFVNFDKRLSFSITINKSQLTIETEKKDFSLTSSGETVAVKGYSFPGLAETFDKLAQIKKAALLHGFVEI